jgi:hypothetical protein
MIKSVTLSLIVEPSEAHLTLKALCKSSSISISKCLIYKYRYIAYIYNNKVCYLYNMMTQEQAHEIRMSVIDIFHEMNMDIIENSQRTMADQMDRVREAQEKVLSLIK